MPLQRFISIENVGRLVRCSQRGPELNRFNLIFGENGRGKTTLCAILRSLKTGRPEYITERRTIGPNPQQPRVSIRLDGANAEYANRAWNRTVPEIAIFDGTFVAQNVYAGDHVGREQRSNLLQLIVGEAGVVLARRVNDLDEQIRRANAAITAARRQVEAHVPRGMMLDAFIGIAEDPDVEAKIAAKTAELVAARRAVEIRNRAPLAIIAPPKLPDDLLPILDRTIEDLSEEAEQRLLAHMQEHRITDENWLSTGLQFVRGDSCGFCGQSVRGLDLIAAYKQHFSEQYKDLRRSVDRVRAEVEAAFGDGQIASHRASFATNQAGLEFWSAFVKAELPPFDLDRDLAPILALRNAARALIDRKLQNPLEAIAPDDAFATATGAVYRTDLLFESYNNAVGTNNRAIQTLKQSVEGADVAALQRQLDALNLTRARFSAPARGACDIYQQQVTDKNRLDGDKAQAKTALDGHADGMIRDYEGTINDFLIGFGAGFLLTNSRKHYVGGTPTSTYQVLINNAPVELGDEATPVGEVCFRTTLSAGDRSTLALAFFLAQLEHDPNKAAKIVVFDDPFNSQDRSRRERTAELLRKFGEECAQLFLLSHDPYFLHILFLKVPNADRRTLQLSRVAANNTTIEEWDAERETQDGYFRDHAALSSYLLNGARNLTDVARKIRPVLEGYIRYRFPNQFPDNEWLGDMIGRIRDAGPNHSLFTALQELSEINDYSKKYHHDTNPGRADNEPLNDGELRAYVARTLKIAGGY